ncbi:MAG: polyphenol oxidase family protein [Akkermansiaceae bacterium]
MNQINAHHGVSADFIGRIEGVAVDYDREATVERLTPHHSTVLEGLGFRWDQLHRAEQVHGGDIKVVNQVDVASTWQDVDGLITADHNIALGIYTADCGAVYLSDPVKGAIGLLHSGKKGTEANITGKAIAMMMERFGSDPRDISMALAPCIRPPVYEVDFAQEIFQQAAAAGIQEVNMSNSGVCTSSDRGKYYSYRIEKGCTGRMLALLGKRG